MNIKEFRAQYPQYDEHSDEDLAKALHAKYYPDVEFADFSAKFMPPEAPPEPKEPSYSGGILPFSRDVHGKTFFDPEAGIVGAVKRAFTAPGEAYKGTIDPYSEEGRERALETAATFSPLSPALKVGVRAIPGAAVSYGEKKVKPVPIEVPTADELKAAMKSSYKAARESGAEYPASEITLFADAVKRRLEEEGFNEIANPAPFALIKKLLAAPDDPSATVTISSLDSARKAFGKITTNPSDQEAARQVIKDIDRFIESWRTPSAGLAAPAGAPGRASIYEAGFPSQATAQSEATAADAARDAAARHIVEARGDAAARFRSKRLTDIDYATWLKAGATGSGQNFGNLTRQHLASLLTNPKKMRGFSPEERKAIEQVVRGTATTNTIRRVSNLLGGGGGLGQSLVAVTGVGTGALYGGTLPTTLMGAAPAVAGAGSRSLANYLTNRQLARVDELTRMRSPLYERRKRGPDPGPLTLLAGPRQRPSYSPLEPNLLRLGAVGAVTAPQEGPLQ